MVLSQDAFTVGGERLRFPGDPQGSPGNTINCRCTVLPVVDGMAAGVEEEATLTAIEPELEFRPSKTNRSKALKYQEAALREAAEIRGMTAEELAAEVEARLATDLQSPISIRRGTRGATSVLESGRFRSMAETRRRHPVILNIEQIGQGIPKDTPGYQRAIYGYVSTNDPTAARCYGAVEFQLKEDVKRRSTIMLGDSAESYRNHEGVSSSYLQPGRESWANMAGRYADGGVGNIGYIETQVQGGVRRQDIARIIIHSEKPEYADIIRLANEHGIEVVVDASLK